MSAKKSRQSYAASAREDEMLSKAYSNGFGYERDYGNCPQCVVGALQDVFPGLIDDSIFKAAHGLVGGTAKTTNGTCGALAGGILAISALFGRDRANFANGPFLDAQKMAKRLYDRFTEEYGSCICHDVQTKEFGRAFDLWDPADFQAFLEAGGHTDKCPDVVGKTARWAAEIILEEQAKSKDTVS